MTLTFWQKSFLPISFTIFLTKDLFAHIFFDKNFYWPTNLLTKIKFWQTNYLTKRNFAKFCFYKIFLIKNDFDQKFLTNNANQWDKKKICTTICLHQIFFWQRNLLTEIYLISKCFYQIFFLTKNAFEINRTNMPTETGIFENSSSILLHVLPKNTSLNLEKFVVSYIVYRKKKYVWPKMFLLANFFCNQFFLPKIVLLKLLV